MLIQRYDLNKNKSMNNIKIILIMLKYKYIPSNSHGYTYSYSSGGDVLYSTSHSIVVNLYLLLYPKRGTPSIGGLSFVLYLNFVICLCSYNLMFK